MRRAIDRKCRIIMPLRTPFTGVIALFALNQHGTCALAWKLTARVPWLGSSLGGWRLCRSRTCSVAPQEQTVQTLEGPDPALLRISLLACSA